MYLPEGVELSRLLDRLRFSDRDKALVEQSRPGGDAPWEMIERAHGALVSSIGERGAPKLPELDHAEPWPGLLDIYLLLSAVPDIRAWYGARGIPEPVLWSTLSDLGRQVDTYYRFHGRVGFDELGWLSLHFRGLLFQLGRLQYERDVADASLARVVGCGEGEDVLGIHIPEAGPLAAELCDESLAMAAPFFARHVPDCSYRIGFCESWLLDEQLQEYLPASSNIVRFQRRFTLVPGGRVDDDAIVRFVFRAHQPDLDRLPQRTTLERAVVRHLREGHNWCVRTGWVRLAP